MQPRKIRSTIRLISEDLIANNNRSASKKIKQVRTLLKHHYVQGEVAVYLVTSMIRL